MAKHSADQALVAHAQADHVGHVPGALEKVHHHHVVGERLGGGDDLDELRLVRPDTFEDSLQILGRLKIVVGDDQSRASGAQFVQFGCLDGFGRLQLQIHQVKA